MTREELKAEIMRIVDTLPESVLAEVLIIIKEIAKKHKDTMRNDELMEKIITDNSEVFKRLAD